jgi:hypothetical protein
MQKRAKSKPDPFVTPRLHVLPFVRSLQGFRASNSKLICCCSSHGCCRSSPALSFSVTPMPRRRRPSILIFCLSNEDDDGCSSSSRFIYGTYGAMISYMRYDPTAVRGQRLRRAPDRRNWCGFWPDIRETNERAPAIGKDMG